MVPHTSAETARDMRAATDIARTFAASADKVAYISLTVAVAAFALYWSSSVALHTANRITHFGADAHVYTAMAQGYYAEGLTRFHPVTMGLAAAWLKLLSPLTHWIPTVYILKSMFAAAGAIGVWAAVRAFAALMPLRQASLFGIIYASSLGIWYFSSIEESKIVTATIAALYIATYVKLRQRWTVRGACLLTAWLLLGCLNEIVSGFLVIIPLVDTLVRKGVDWRGGRWIFAHALAGPCALLILELGVSRWLLTPERTNLERASHLDMLISFVSGNEYTATSLMFFLREWLIFSIAAPSADATTGAAPSLHFAGTFAPSLLGYFASPLGAGVAVLGLALLVVCLLPGRQPAGDGGRRALLLALGAYALFRALFFVVMLPHEPLLNASTTTLAHLLILAGLFAASRVPGKTLVLAGFAVLLFAANAAFIIGP